MKTSDCCVTDERISRFSLCSSIFLLLWITTDVAANSNLGTLKTFQAFACDGELLNIRCPHATTISVQYAQYGRQSTSDLLCPPRTNDDEELLAENDNTSCLASDALKVVVGACQEKRQCRVQTAPRLFGPDPCPGLRKYAEVTYKCRPHEFITKVICEREQLHLKCHKGSRIAIYSAAFGRTLHGNVECPQPDGVPEEECQASYSTEAVMRICHGKRKCTMMADIQAFGNPCSERTRSYLRVIYTCVPTRILKTMYQNAGDDYDGGEMDAEGDEELVEEPSYRSPSSDDDEEREESTKTTKESAKKKLSALEDQAPTTTFVSPPAPPRSSAAAAAAPIGTTRDVQSDDSEEDATTSSTVATTADANCSVAAAAPDEAASIGIVTEWISAFNFLRGNKEKLILYLAVSISIGLIVFMSVVIVRLLYQKRRERRCAKLNISEPLPNGFCDDLSDVDQDITDLSSHRQGHDPSVAMVRYTSRSTMRRQDSDTNPRAPISRSHNNFYYS